MHNLSFHVCLHYCYLPVFIPAFYLDDFQVVKLLALSYTDTYLLWKDFAVRQFELCHHIHILLLLQLSNQVTIVKIAWL